MHCPMHVQSLSCKLKIVPAKDESMIATQTFLTTVRQKYAENFLALPTQQKQLPPSTVNVPQMEWHLQ